MTQQLRDTFAAHEHLAPDADLALEAIEQRIRTRRRSQLAVTGAVVAVAGIVAGASVVASGTHERAGTQSRPAATRPSALPARDALPAPDHVTLAAGWLPPGTVTSAGRSSYFGTQQQGYLVSSNLLINITLTGGTALPTQNKRGTPHDRPINGRPGREWSVDDWYYLAFRAPNGHVATVDVEGGKNQGKGGDGSAPELAATGQHVARTLRFDQHVAIDPAFRLSYLPAGLAIAAVDRQSYKGPDYTSYAAVPPGTGDSSTRRMDVTEQAGTWASLLQNIQEKIRLAHNKGLAPSGAQRQSPGRPVQGHPTHILGTPGQPILFIDSVRPGTSIEITGGTLAEQYKVADGLILS